MLKEIFVKCKTSLLELIVSEAQLGHFQAQKVLRDRHVKVNGRRVGDDQSVDEKDVVHVYMRDREIKQVEIVFMDKNVAVVNKMAGLETEGEDSLTQRLNEQLEEATALPVHRLDRNTMGLVVFALNESTQKELLTLFKDREMDKYYYAIVSGNPQKQANLKAFLFKDAKKSEVYISPVQKQGYLPIETNYKFIRKKGELSLLEVKLITGRTHQIRAHLAFEKLPVVGDGKYGINAINKRYKIKQQALCCYKLIFHFGEKSPLRYLDNKVVKTEIDLFEMITF